MFSGFKIPGSHFKSHDAQSERLVCCLPFLIVCGSALGSVIFCSIVAFFGHSEKLLSACLQIWLLFRKFAHRRMNPALHKTHRQTCALYSDGHYFLNIGGKMGKTSRGPVAAQHFWQFVTHRPYPVSSFTCGLPPSTNVHILATPVKRGIVGLASIWASIFALFRHSLYVAKPLPSTTPFCPEIVQVASGFFCNSIEVSRITAKF